MNCCDETTKMGVPSGNRPAVPRDWFRDLPEWYVAGADTCGPMASGSEGRTAVSVVRLRRIHRTSRLGPARAMEVRQ